MGKIALLTDSASDISMELLQKNNIKLLPFKIIYKDKEYDDRIEITPQMMYERLENEIPKTSLPSIEKMTNALQQAVEEGCTHAIIITISSAFSGTNNAARIVCEDFKDIETFVFDTKTLSAAQGIMVLKTAEMIRSGKSFKEITEALPTFRDKIDSYFALDTLEYLKKGGRIGAVAGTVGEFLNLKPIITVADDGTFMGIGKARGSKQALSKLVSILKGYLDKGKHSVWIVNGNASDKVQWLMDTIKDLPNLVEYNVAGITGPALGVNTGSGSVGIVIEKLD